MKPEIVAAFQGEPGAYSEEAILRYFGREVPTRGYPTFEEVIHSVESGEAEYGFLPAENSIAGTVASSYDLLLDSRLTIAGEVYCPVHHNLLAIPGTSLEAVEVVYSHPQALDQCRHFIRRRGFRAIPEFDTAGSARRIAQEKPSNAAAIASKRAAVLYELQILAESIEDVPGNTTRFFVLSKPVRSRKELPRAERNKTSILFTLRHQPGELYRALGEFAERGINLTKIESRPEKTRPWHYIFYIDLEGHIEDPPVEKALLALLKRAVFLKVLGSYPAGDSK